MAQHPRAGLPGPNRDRAGARPVDRRDERDRGPDAARATPRIQTVDNPGTDIPIGLNAAIRAAPAPGHRARRRAHRAARRLHPPRRRHAARARARRTSAGSCARVGRPGLQAAVARAYNSPLGLGGGAYHAADEPAGPAESAYLGVMRAEALAEVGGFDETLRRGEDWELNHRFREAGSRSCGSTRRCRCTTGRARRGRRCCASSSPPASGAASWCAGCTGATRRASSPRRCWSWPPAPPSCSCPSLAGAALACAGRGRGARAAGLRRAARRRGRRAGGGGSLRDRLRYAACSPSCTTRGAPASCSGSCARGGAVDRSGEPIGSSRFRRRAHPSQPSSSIRATTRSPAWPSSYGANFACHAA